MMKEAVYVKKTLAKDEEIKWVADLHWIVWIKALGLALLALLILCVAVITHQMETGGVLGTLCLVFAFYLWLCWKKTEYVVTNRRVVAKRGIIAVHTEELRNAKVESILIQQKIWERLLGCGTVVFAGTGGSKVLFKSISQPRQLKMRLDDIIEGYDE